VKEALRYLQNAKEILKKAPIEDGRYADVKYVQEACGTAYLAIIKAIDGYLMNKGLSKKELPKSTEGYRKALQKYWGMLMLSKRLLKLQRFLLKRLDLDEELLFSFVTVFLP
jgi:hypothetical protein